MPRQTVSTPQATDRSTPEAILAPALLRLVSVKPYVYIPVISQFDKTRFPAAHDSASYGAGDAWSSDIITRCLMVTSRAAVTQEQICGLFDLIPGMDLCEMQRDQYGFNKGQCNFDIGMNSV